MFYMISARGSLTPIMPQAILIGGDANKFHFIFFSGFDHDHCSRKKEYKAYLMIILYNLYDKEWCLDGFLIISIFLELVV